MKTKKSTKGEAKTEAKPKRKYKTKAKRKYERKADKAEPKALVSRAEWEAGMTWETERDMRLITGFILGVFSPMLKEVVQEEVKAALAQLKMQGQDGSAFSRWQGEQKRAYGSFSS
jgi:hypothetical protein